MEKHRFRRALGELPEIMPCLVSMQLMHGHFDTKVVIKMRNFVIKSGYFLVSCDNDKYYKQIGKSLENFCP